MSKVQILFPLFYLLAFLAQLDRATVFVRFIMIFKIDSGLLKLEEKICGLIYFKRRLLKLFKKIFLKTYWKQNIFIIKGWLMLKSISSLYKVNWVSYTILLNNVELGMLRSFFIICIYPRILYRIHEIFQFLVFLQCK